MSKSKFLKSIKDIVKSVENDVLGNLTDVRGQTIKLAYAAMNKNENVTEMQNCINNGAVVHERNKTGRNALHEVALNGANPENMEFLISNLKKPEDINMKTSSGFMSRFSTNSNGFTALGFAKLQMERLDSGFKTSGSKKNILKTINILKKAGAELSSADKQSLNMINEIKQAPSIQIKSPSIG